MVITGTAGPVAPPQARAERTFRSSAHAYQPSHRSIRIDLEAPVSRTTRIAAVALFTALLSAATATTASAGSISWDSVTATATAASVRWDTSAQATALDSISWD